MKLIISLAPRTKKNHGRLVRAKGRQFLLPSKTWQVWCDTAVIRLDRPPQLLGWEWAGLGIVEDVLLPDQALNCAAVFYRDARRGEAVGYYQGLADLLEKRRVITNDVQIVSWDGTRMSLDPSNPRTVVELTEVSG